MLKHMIKAEVLELIVARMDLVVAVLEVALNHKSTWITSLGGTGMVRASIAAFGLNVRNVAVVGDDLLDEVGQTSVDIVGDDANRLGLARLDGLVDVSR